MRHTISTVKFVSSSADNARTIVAEFCQDALTETNTRLSRLRSIAELESILDATQLAVAADVRAGIRHLMAALQEVSEHHQRGEMSGRFDEALAHIAKAQVEAEERYRWLHMLYTRD